MWTLSGFADEISPDLTEQCEVASGLGLKYIEVRSAWDVNILDLSPDQLATLKKTVQDVPRTRTVVVYCGCCPMGDCPNIRPAYQALREMGFKTVKVLNLPTNFTQDWQMKGYPVEKGGA